LSIDLVADERFGRVAYAELGQFDDAWRCISEAMTEIETTKERWWEAEVHRTAGEVVLKSPQPNAAKAEANFERALAVARQQQAKSWELRAATSMARLWRDQGKPKQALWVESSSTSDPRLRGALPRGDIARLALNERGRQLRATPLD
jgi:predicted ATPase